MDDWLIGVILALFVIIPCWLAIFRKNEVRRQVKGWVELAERTGLIFDSNIFNVPVRIDHYPGLRGEYRGHSVSITLLGDSERNDPPNTSISLHVANCAHFSLSIQAKKFHDYIHGVTEVSSGNVDFDRRFSIEGSPKEYLLSAVDLIVRSDRPLLGWIFQHFPSIELREETLTCAQNGELTNVINQLALLNLLCDLVELAEQMGSKVT